MEERFLLSIKRLNIDINYIRNVLSYYFKYYFNQDVSTDINAKDINDYNDLKLFLELCSFTEDKSAYKSFMYQFVNFILLKPDPPLNKKIDFMIRNKYLNKNLSIKISYLRSYIISAKYYKYSISRLSKLYFELEDYYFENEYRRLELLKY